MRKYRVELIILFLINLTWLGISHAQVPAQPSRARVVGGQLIVEKRLGNGTLDEPSAYIIKGITWQPATRAPKEGPNPLNPAETVPYGFFFDWPGRVPQGYQVLGYWLRQEPKDHYALDLKLMKKMNINTVRVYNDFGDDPEVYTKILDTFYRNNIFVIMTVAISKEDLDNNAHLTIVQRYKNHPAILMWSLGNEWNLNKLYSPYNLDEALSAIERAAQDIKELDPFHPVSSCLGDVFTLPACAPDDTCCMGSLSLWKVGDIVSRSNFIDIWGLNVYRGASLGILFEQWKALTSKPFFLSEIGADSFNAATFTKVNCVQADNVTGAQDQGAQASLVLGLWREVNAHLSFFYPTEPCVGAAVHEFNDELWKVGCYHMGLGGLVDYASPTEGRSYDWQNPEGFILPVLNPDHVFNEEYFGVVTADRKPKKVYTELQGFYARLNYALPAPTGLSLDAFAGQFIRLQWRDNSGNEDGFRIERATIKTGPYLEIAVVNKDATAYTDQGLSARVKYYYRVKAYKGVVSSAYSNTASVRAKR